MMKRTLTLALCATALIACEKKEYCSNDPNAAPDAATCYAVQDYGRTYKHFFQPKNAWVGDPMPFYDNGRFHIFYLYDQRPAPATFHPWYSATTTDLVNYTDNGEAIACGADGSHEDALGTGSVFKDGNTYYAFYTGHNGDLDPKEIIYWATSTDLKTWTKDTQHFFRAPDGYDRNEFRDPIVFKEGNAYKMLLSTRADIGAGVWKAVVAQFTSTNLKNWTKDPNTPFFYTDPSAFMVECPDVFTQGNYQYLIFSNIEESVRRVQYRYRRIGSTDWITPAQQDLDDRVFYAGKTATDGTHRYIWGWNPSRINYEDNAAYHWGGSLAVHELTQNADGTLNVKMPTAFDSKQAVSASLGSISLDNNTRVFDRLGTGFNKIVAKIKANTATEFGVMFGACGNLYETYRVTLNLNKGELQLNRVIRDGGNATINSIKLPANANKEYTVKIVQEGSAAAVYVNDAVALSIRCYKMNQNPWGIFANGTANFQF
jgi:glycosyl hydrolase family 32 domain protein